MAARSLGTIARQLVRQPMRAIPAAAVLLTFCHLGRGGFHGLSRLGWWEAGSVTLLLVGIALSGVRRFRREAIGAPVLLQDDLELGGCLIAAVYAIVAICGAPLYPLIYLVMALVVSFLPRVAGFTLLGVAAVFEAMVTLGGTTSQLAAFITHAAFLGLFAALYHFVLSTRLAMARKAESEAVRNRIKEVEERARTFRLVHSGTHDSFKGVADQEKWLVASVKEIEGAVGAALEIVETALKTYTCGAFLLTTDDRSLKLYDCRSASDRV